MNTPLGPILTFGDIYPRRHAYSTRPHPRRNRYLSQDAAILDALTGDQLTCMGDFDVVVSDGCLSPAGLELIAEAGLPTARRTHRFRHHDEAFDIVRSLGKNGHKIVMQHVYPADVLPVEQSWVEPALLSRLNNKRHLCDYVEQAHLPERWLTTWAQLFDSDMPLPFVIKIPTDDSATAGGGVAVCRTRDDAVAARQRFTVVEEIVVETFLDTTHNPCLNFAVLPSGEIRFLGFAEQHVTDTGAYRGNWIGAADTLPEIAITAAQTAVARGAAEGYVGIVGIDIVILPDGRVLVIDLNFRVNGSTPALLLQPAIARQIAPPVIHRRSFVASDGFNHMLAIARPAARERRLIPLNFFDPRRTSHNPTTTPARMAALVLADSREDALAYESELANQGLH